MVRKKERLIYKLAIVFVNFTIVTLIISWFMTYISQMETYKKLCIQNSRGIVDYLSREMEAWGPETENYIEYYMSHYRDIEMPYDFDNYVYAQSEYERLRNEQYPGKAMWQDITFSDLSPEVQEAYFIYVQEYWVLMFENARDAFGQAYTYFLVVDDPRARTEDIDKDYDYSVVYVVDGERTEVKDENGVGTGKLWLGDTYGHKYAENSVEWETFSQGSLLNEYYEWNNEWGNTYTYYAPLRINNKTLGLVCTDVEVKKINETILQNSLVQIAGIAVVLIICMAVMVWFINRFYISKVVALEGRVRKFTEDKDPATADVLERNIVTDDELASLGHQTAAMMREIDRHIHEITDMAATQERLTGELNVATKIQRDMMPTDFPKRGDIDLYAVMSPAKEVGGDFYDFFFIDSDHLGLVMADVSGKGVPAALFMVIAKTLLMNMALMGGSPARVLDDVNFRLLESSNNAMSMFVTAWFGILTLSTGELTYANAGHEYPAIKRAGGKYELAVSENCPPLASTDDVAYYEETIRLNAGDSIFLYTDGVPEAKNGEGKRLGTTKMLEILNATPDLAPYERLTGLKELIDDFAGELDQFDDITMMCIDYLKR